MWAVLRVITRTLLVNGDGTEWHEKLSVKAKVQDYPDNVKMETVANPTPPASQVEKCTFTTSQFPADLDKAIVNKIKGKKVLQKLDSDDFPGDIYKGMDKITSINQIHMQTSHPQKNKCLDDIFIDLPLMLEWICKEGWHLEQMSQDMYRSTYIFKQVN